MTKKTKDDVRVDFDPYTPTPLLNPAYIDSRLQQKCPVAWSEHHGGFWYVTEYENVDRVGKDWRYFSNCNGNVMPPPPYSRIAMVFDDPPVHATYRRPLNPLLTREAVQERLVPRIKYWTDAFIDRVIELGQCDLMYDLAVPVPTAVTDSRIDEELAARREAPRDDAMSSVLTIDIDGKPISQEDAVSLVRVLIGAGVDTTTSVLGSAFVHLHFNPGDRKRLIDEPELMESATEEFLRRYPPTRTLYRTCVAETEINGVTIQPGEQVLTSILASNMQEDVFPDPVAFVPDRTPNRHLSFGMGVHRCVGMHLGRAEFVGIMSEVLGRMADYALLEEQLVSYVRQGVMAGWTTAPATFTPGPRKLPEDEAAPAVPVMS